jgi:hypothetical protein
MVFVVVRTYYLIWRMNKGRDVEKFQPDSRGGLEKNKKSR